MTEHPRFRAVFISDVHLGASASRADHAADFLKLIRCDILFLVGDIIDMWRLRSRWHWPESHNRFVRRILKMSKRGTRIVFIPGNHDQHARDYAGLSFGGVEVATSAIHTTASGRRYLITHGDEADIVIRHARLLSMIGGTAYDLLVVANRAHSRLLLALGFKPWSLAQAVKNKVKSACRHIARFEETLATLAAERGLDGVICGHIHKPAHLTLPGGIEYLNCGDWVEGASAIVEHADGSLHLLDAAAFMAPRAPHALDGSHRRRRSHRAPAGAAHTDSADPDGRTNAWAGIPMSTKSGSLPSALRAGSR
jgi:UDP-2,3-diacylglucosamine pyrophosphatase LpxH